MTATVSEEKSSLWIFGPLPHKLRLRDKLVVRAALSRHRCTVAVDDEHVRWLGDPVLNQGVGTLDLEWDESVQ